MGSHNDNFRRLRKEKQDQIFTITNRLLLRVELLTNTNEHIPRNTNTKERRSITNQNFSYYSYCFL